VRYLALATLLAAFAAPAHAGGNFMDIAADSATVWVTGDFGIDQLDARTGRELRQVVLGSLYPLSVGIGGGAAWVASVESGYGSGTVTRIDETTGRARVLLRRNWSAQKIAVAGGSVWVLLGSRGPYRVARFDLAGRLRALVAVGRDAGWLTADERGAWVCCRGRTLLRVDRAGRVHPAFSLPTANPVWAADGSLWLAGQSVLDRIDEQTGRLIARVPLAFPYGVAAGEGSVYALGNQTVIRIDPATNRVLARRPIPGIAQAVSGTAAGVWVAFTRQTTSRVFRLDPRTLAVELRLALY
jgi:hypothetical protein